MCTVVKTLPALAAVLALAGCGGPSEVTIHSPDPAPTAVGASGSPTPSYPIRLVDLPNLQSGLAVAPARPNGFTVIDRDLDAPPRATVVRPPSPAAAPPATTPPAAARPAAPRKPAPPIDVTLVP